MEKWLPLEELAPVERSTLYEAKGLALLSLKRSDLARAEFASALKFYTNINAQAGIATVDYLDGEYQKARQRALDVLRQDPHNRLARQVVEKTNGLR
jgi:Flp pilus assembly protein TadD